MKYIIIVPDGMADNPIEELNGKTPLEAANTTNMDHLAKNGRIGLVQTIPDGMPPGSDIGNMAILGYDPTTCHTGRSPLEAANQNIMLDDNQVAFRCNLVTIVNNKMEDYSAGHISTDEAKLLIQSLNEELADNHTKFYLGKSYRHLLTLNVRNTQHYMDIKTTPPHDILGKDIKDYLPHGTQSVMIQKLIEKSKEIFADHSVNKVRIDLGENPANMIWLWGQGTKPNLPSFKDKYGIKGSIISAVDLVNGIGRLAGLEIIDVPNITGYYDTDYAAKAEYALQALNTNDYVYVHIEAPDEAGHNGDLKEKIRAIEQIDKKVIGPILNHYNQHDDVRILVLPDHPTPVELRTHTSDPVGFVMYGKGVAHDGSQTFNESSARAKGLTYTSGEALINDFIKKGL